MIYKTVTKKQKTIQTLIYSFRFINSKQIQKFLGHKDHRRVNSWLKDLTDQKFIVRDFTQRFGTSTKPAIYYLASSGRRYMRNSFSNVSKAYLRRIIDDKKRSKSFRVKCQIIADCYLLLFEETVLEYPQTLEMWLSTGIKLKFNQFHFFTPALYENLDFVLLPELKPDAYCLIQREESITHTMIYVLDAYIPRLMLSYLIKRIFNKLNETYWEDGVEALHIYFVCPSNMVIVYLRRLLPRFLENYYGKTLVFHFATRNQLYARQKYNRKETGWINVSSED
jgi:hypothetical protein